MSLSPLQMSILNSLSTHMSPELPKVVEKALKSKVRVKGIKLCKLHPMPMSALASLPAHSILPKGRVVMSRRKSKQTSL